MSAPVTSASNVASGGAQKRILPWLIWAHIAMVSAAVAGVYLTTRHQMARQAAVIPVYSQVPDFSLVDSAGAPFKRSDLDGKVWVADFVYTTCPGPCPMVTSKFADFQNVVANLPDARMVTVTVNPEVDTPEKLRDYAKLFDASDRWIFLTGRKDDIFRLVRDGFKLAVTEAEGQEPVIHSTKLVLVDQAGYIRGFYDSLNPAEIRKLTEDMTRLVR